MMQKSIEQVLLLRDRKVSKEMGTVLWAGLKEVDAFFNRDQQRATINLTYLSDYVPKNLEGSIQAFRFDISAILDRTTRLFQFLQDVKKGEQTSDASRSLDMPEELFEHSKGRFHRTYDAAILQELIVPVLKTKYGDRPVRSDILIVTDQEITPPANYNYIIWSQKVVSIAPTDPMKYWGVEDPNRIAVIKHRVRSACLNIVGSLLGLERCDNEFCFLYSNVDSVLRLDSMVKLGAEHGLDALTDHGFEIRPKDPSLVQPVVKNPQPGEEWI